MQRKRHSNWHELYGSGNLATAIGTSSSAYGDSSFASGDYSTALGDFAAAQGLQSTAVGDVASALSPNASAFGENANVSAAATNGTAWYRLKIKSLQGATSYSQVVSLANQGSALMKGVIISNTLQLMLPPKARTINIFDANGKLLLNKAVSNSIVERISLSNFSKGILAVQVQGDGFSETIQVLY